MNDERNLWLRKFQQAARGAAWAILHERNFRVHLAVAAAVVTAATVLQASFVEWCLLLACIGVVLAAEFFNTAIEQLARAITRQHDEQTGRALDIAAGAVLITSVFAAVVGALIFIHRL